MALARANAGSEAKMRYSDPHHRRFPNGAVSNYAGRYVGDTLLAHFTYSRRIPRSPLTQRYTRIGFLTAIDPYPPMWIDMQRPGALKPREIFRRNVRGGFTAQTVNPLVDIAHRIIRRRRRGYIIFWWSVRHIVFVGHR